MPKIQHGRLLPQTPTDRDELFEDLEDLFDKYITARDIVDETEMKEKIFGFLDKGVRKTDFSLEPKEREPDLMGTTYSDFH
jgi:hypothetical protein